MGKVYYNNDKTESIELPALDVDVIALSMSGGADSSLLCYLVAKNIIENNSKTVILPFTRYRPYPKDAPMSWNVKRARQVIEKIKTLLGKNVFLDHYIDYPPTHDRLSSSEEKILVEQLHNKIGMMVNFLGYKTWKFYYGVTSNPSKEEMQKNNFLMDYRMEDRDSKNRNKSPTRPFDLVDKRFIADIYKQENILDSIFPITYSCEWDAKTTNNYSLHCEKCWWCKERYWAFGRFV